MSLFTLSVLLSVFPLLVFVYLHPFIYDFLKFLLFPISCIHLHSNPQSRFLNCQFEFRFGKFPVFRLKLLLLSGNF